MRHLFLLLLVAWLTSATLPAVAQTTETRLLTVAASAEVRAVPDIALVQLGVETQAPTAQAAMAENAQRMTRVISALRGLGIPDRDLQTSAVSLVPIYRQDRPQDAPQLVGYRAHNAVAAQLLELGKIGAAIDAGVAAGANLVQGVSFRLSDEMPYRQRALWQAGRNARLKAEALATGLDLRLGAVESATEIGHQVTPVSERAGAFGDATPVLPGELIVRVDVQVRFRIAP